MEHLVAWTESRHNLKEGDMGERRFVIDLVENYHSMAPINIVTESELINRINHVRKPEFIIIPHAIDIMLHGCHGTEKEQEVAHLTKCTCERCTGIAVESLYEEQPEPPKLTRKDWEEWADRMETHIIMRDDIKGAFLTMPGVPKELP